MCLASSRFWITSTTVMLATPLLWIDEKGTQMFYDTTGGTVGDKKVPFPLYGRSTIFTVSVPFSFRFRFINVRHLHVVSTCDKTPFRLVIVLVPGVKTTHRSESDLSRYHQARRVDRPT